MTDAPSTLFEVRRQNAMEWFESLKVDDIRPAAERWSRWDRLLAAVLAATLLVALLFLFFPLWRQRHSMESRLRILDRELQTNETRGLQLRREIDALQNDPAYIEHVAREKLNLAAPGETLFQFDAPSTVPTGSGQGRPR